MFYTKNYKLSLAKVKLAIRRKNQRKKLLQKTTWCDDKRKIKKSIKFIKFYWKKDRMIEEKLIEKQLLSFWEKIEKIFLIIKK